MLSVLLVFMTVQYCIRGHQIPVRHTENGAVAGVVQHGFPRGDVEVFYGIPYAAPPIDDLRFEDPVPHSNWTGVRQATKLPPICRQAFGYRRYLPSYRLGLNKSSEDCLYLNVYVPVNDDGGDMSVLLFIHSGSHVVGTGLMFDAGYLASQGQIVVVTINFRLGVFGFLGSGEPEFRGNYGMMDQIMAMKWIKNNIAHFKGHPDKVTVLGHGAGGFDVGLHLISPLSKGLFHALISQSGSPTVRLAWKPPRADPREEVRNVSHIIGCTNTTLRDMKRCLKGVPYFELIWGRYRFRAFDRYEFPTLVDGRFLPEEPEKLFKKKQFNTNNYVIGYTTSGGDLNAEYYGTLRRTIEILQDYYIVPSRVNVSETLRLEYTNWTSPNVESSTKTGISNLLSDATFRVDSIVTAGLASDGGVRTYMYQWDHSLDKSINNNFKDWMRVPHGVDMFYLFGWPLSGHHIYNFTALDKNISLAMMETWSNYVKHGVFSTNSSLDQNRELTYETTNMTYLRFHAENGHLEVTMENNPLPRQVHFWKTYLPRLAERLFQARPHTTASTTVTTPSSSADFVRCHLSRWNIYTALVILSRMAVC